MLPSKRGLFTKLCVEATLPLLPQWVRPCWKRATSAQRPTAPCCAGAQGRTPLALQVVAGVLRLDGRAQEEHQVPLVV